MSRAAPVDRELELGLFERMLAGETPERILLVSAESGWGKSELLREFAHRCPTELHYAPLDFKAGGIGLAELLSRLRDSLGLAHFPTLNAAVTQLANPTINIPGNVLIGQNTIEVALNAPDEQTREARRAALTTAFFADLRAMGKVLLVFDTFEKCDEGIKVWLGGTFLNHAHRSPNLVVVIAGQKVPEATIDWEHQHIPLKGIAAEHWHRHAQANGIAVSLDWINGCCHALQGHPLKMAELLNSLQERR